MAKVNLALLGGLRLQTDPGEPVPFSTKKAGALLAYLALHPGQAQSRPKLAALLWGDHSEVQARDSLRQALTLVRKALSRVEPRALIAHEDTITFEPKALTTDAILFGDLVAQQGAEDLEQAVALYGGELFEGFQVRAPEFESWVTAERERFREMAVEAMTKLLDHHMSTGAVEPGIRIGARLLVADPLQERVHRTLMELYCRQGRYGAALRQYRTCADLLAKELGIEPDAQTKALRRDILRGWNRRGSLERRADRVLRDEAEKLDADIPATELKHVTVLCLDIKESLECIVQRDPEQALRIFEAVLKLMTQVVHRYDGTVILKAGDGLTAAFGLPVAQEDHAVRACYAALQIQEAVRGCAQALQDSALVPLMVCAGLDSGEVVVRSIGRGSDAEHRAMGQTMHLAARLGQIAAPGALLLSAATLRLAEGHVEARALQSAKVPGLSGSVYELVGTGPAQTRFQMLAARGLTRFVGRDLELEQLRRVQQLAGKGDGQVVAIVGEAGVGKSRLIYEFIRSHDLPDWLVLAASSVSYGKVTSYGPVVDLLKGYFKIQERDDLRQMREKVTDKLLSLDRALAPMLPELLSLLDLPVDDATWLRLDPRQRRQRTLDAVKRLLLRETRQQPLLVIFEDLHWIDSETQVLLDNLVDSLGSARLLLLVSHRPGYQHAWMTRTHYSRLRLDALSAESARELLNSLLGDDPSLAPLKHVLIRRGNPFFLEETVRTLIETEALAGERGHHRLVRPIQAIQVPATVQAMLAERIDRLPPDDKLLLQTASVVGKDVPLALLEPIAELPEEALRRGLDRLRSAGFMYETGQFPEVEYSFKHALTHKVTYAGMLRERRRELHARIVDILETRHPDRLSGEIERLAHHALKGELGERAVHYLRQAGAKAAARSALPEAQIWFEQALSAIDALPKSQPNLEQAFEIRIDLRPVLTLRSEFRAALERLREAEALAERLNDDSRRGRVYAFMTNIHTQLGERDDGLVTSSRALKIAERLGDVRLRIIATTYLAQTHYYHGEYKHAVELAAGILATVPADWVNECFGLPTPASIYLRWFLLPSLAHLGRFAEMAKDEVEAIRLAEPTEHAYTIGETYQAAGVVRLIRGDWAGACSLLEHSIAVLRAGNVLLSLPPNLAGAAWALAQLGEEDRALERVRETELLLEHHAARGLLVMRRWPSRWLARAYLRLGRFDDAQRLGNCAVECLPPQTGLAAQTFHLLGDIASHPNGFDAEGAQAHYARALALAEPRGMRPLVARCHLGRGTLYRKVGRREEARAALSRSVELFRDMDMTFWLSQAEAELAKTA
jgi:DNA-binding SARP family transcriptional activator